MSAATRSLYLSTMSTRRLSTSAHARIIRGLVDFQNRDHILDPFALGNTTAKAAVEIATKRRFEIRGGLLYPETTSGMWDGDCPFVAADPQRNSIRVFNPANGSHYYLERARRVEVGLEYVIFRESIPASRSTPVTHGSFYRQGKEADPMRPTVLSVDGERVRIREMGGSFGDWLFYRVTAVDRR